MTETSRVWSFLVAAERSLHQGKTMLNRPKMQLIDDAGALVEQALEASRSTPAPRAESVRGTAAPAEGGGGHGLEDLIASLQRCGENDLYARVVQAVDRVLLAEVLRQTRGNQLRASAILGIDRKTLRQKLRNLGLVPNHVLADAHGHHPVAPGRGDWSRYRG
jgi:DNA-binding protein Fis